MATRITYSALVELAGKLNAVTGRTYLISQGSPQETGRRMYALTVVVNGLNGSDYVKGTETDKGYFYQPSYLLAQRIEEMIAESESPEMPY